MGIAILDYLFPVLAYAGALTLVVVALMVGFWPLVESPLIRTLLALRDWRARRRMRAAQRRAARWFDWRR